MYDDVEYKKIDGWRWIEAGRVLFFMSWEGQEWLDMVAGGRN